MITDNTKFKADLKDVKIFGGEYDGVQRYDRYKYPITEKLKEALDGATWFPKEVNFSKDRIAITTMDEKHVTMYQETLIFQTMADSVANRFLDGVLARFCTSPEWEGLLKKQANQELVHSEAYSYNIKKVYDDGATEFFNAGMQDAFITKRLELEVSVYEELEELTKIETNEDKLLLLKAIYHQYALECVRFQVSFLISFLIDDLYDHSLQGTVTNNKLILNDEFSHTVIFSNLINILKKETSEGFSHLIKGKDIVKVFEEVVQSEIDWFKYLTRDTYIPGATLEDVKTFLHDKAASSLRMIRVDSNFTRTKDNHLVKYFEQESKINDALSLGQESNTIAYNIGTLVKSNKALKEVSDEMLDFFNSIKV